MAHREVLQTLRSSLAGQFAGSLQPPTRDTHAVDQNDWLVIAAIVVAVLIGVATVAATRRWGNRRRRLLFAVEAVPLLPPGKPDGLLQVTYRDFPVNDPHLVTARLRNVGPSDIATAHFDGGRPLILRLNCKLYGVTRSSHPQSTTLPAVGAQGDLKFVPQLMRRGEEWAIEAVVEGEPEPVLDSPLIDTDVIEGPSYLQQAIETLSGVVLNLPFGVTIGIKRDVGSE